MIDGLDVSKVVSTFHQSARISARQMGWATRIAQTTFRRRNEVRSLCKSVFVDKLSFRSSFCWSDRSTASHSGSARKLLTKDTITRISFPLCEWNRNNFPRQISFDSRGNSTSCNSSDTQVTDSRWKSSIPPVLPTLVIALEAEVLAHSASDSVTHATRMFRLGTFLGQQMEANGAPPKEHLRVRDKTIFHALHPFNSSA